MVLIAGVLMASGYALKKIMQPSNIESLNPQDQSYEMPRARTETPGYSLAGHKVIRTMHAAPGQAKPLAQVTGAAPVVAKIDPKAAAVKTPAKKADAKKTTKTAQKKKPQVTVTMIENKRPSMSGLQDKAGAYDPNQQMAGFAPAETTPNPVTQNTEDTTKMSVSQWRSLLMAQPTAKNGADFLAAFQTHDVDETSFYQISDELLSDNSTDRQNLGLNLLKSVPSVRSFTVMLKHYQEKTPQPLRSQIYSALKSYGDVSRFSILVKLLYSADENVVQTAQAILGSTLASLNTNNGQGSGRDTRSPGSTPITAKQFETFIPALRRLVASSDATVAQQAQSLLESILALGSA